MLPNKKKVLILDANQRSALAATRSLGSKKIPIVVADAIPGTLAGASRYSMDTFVYPSPHHDTQSFIEALKKECLQREIEIILPMTEITTQLLIQNKDEFPGICIPFACFEAFEMLSNKWRLSCLSKQLDINIPDTHYIQSRVDLETVWEKLSYPAVLKPYRSRIFTQGKWIEASVEYAFSRHDIETLTFSNDCFNFHPFLIQKFIPGWGEGIFALYNHGKPIVFFAHRRIREKPPSGGVSVLRESVRLDPNLQEIAQRILDQVCWHGVAMVEFKISFDGVPYLMEVNARFWGSLQLAIDAGVDFPYLLYKVAIGEHLDEDTYYKLGIKSRWLLGDLDHLYLALMERKSTSSKIWELLCFLNFFDRNTFFEINRLDDLHPFYFEFKEYVKKIWR